VKHNYKQHVFIKEDVELCNHSGYEHDLVGLTLPDMTFTLYYTGEQVYRQDDLDCTHCSSHWYQMVLVP